MDSSSSAMETESHGVPDSEFAHSPWVELGTFTSPQHSPPIPEYSGFDYHQSPLMVDATYGMSIPPPYAPMPLPMPSHSWPSMLTHHQSPFHESGLPPAPVPTSVSPSAPAPPVRKTSTGGPTPRRTLTDEDRRQMCLYHEENKQAKQTDIGALFGVERSTVSKVLRQKEKYLNPDDGSRSPIKRAKGRVPDVEKALSNWARKNQREGFPISDEMIKQRAFVFASTCVCPEGNEKVLTSSWLEKFKQKNSSLLGAKPRKGSSDRNGERSESDSPTRTNTDSANESIMHSPSGRSPVSPANGFGSPRSPARSQEGVKREPVDELPELTGGYQHGHSKSTTSLDTSSSVGMTSPTSTLVSDSPFTPTSQQRLPTSGVNTNRPRSQTFPLVPIDPSLLSADESQCTKQEQQEQQEHQYGVTILQSPLEMGEDESRVAIKGTDPSKMIKRNRSNPEIKTKSMQPPPAVSKSSTISPISAPSSPTQDEARRALELVMNYFQHQPAGLAAQEYVTIGKLMERLELAKSQQSTLLGGLTRIDEHDDVPRVNKKRSIRNIG
ncbi:uncharacterized protein N7482_008372 [Penicillium canariense]|uniref:HTH CENPB-type domain-containing protein n=1 Tax=Penicillium canariense TaxID=189055 RepID=A0A9W9LIP2_9EURO|nr:uncharacterized protein N7482_008372 [Penicillium canariense]KAJ5157272.1 hypothetical protein N7482_008372 [Penicillium canariense]